MLEGKVALVTGGSSGIGKASALRLAKAGAKVAVVASSSVSKAQEVVAQIEAEGGTGAAYAVDMRNAADVASLVKRVAADLGGIDVLVTSAGIFLPTPIGEADLDVFNQMVDVNIKGTFYAINAVSPIMKDAGGGKIICISSAADRIGIGGFSTYCATKAAVSQMVKTLAIELAGHNININAVSPGNTATPMNDAMRNDPAQRGLLDALTNMTPSQTNFTQPADIAEIVLFLAESPGSSAMHGSCLLADEGLSAGVVLG